MPRLARTVFAGVPHHITQRGNRREDVFFTDDGRRTYLEWLKAYCAQRADAVLTPAAVWRERLAAVDDWSAWLAEGDESEELAVLRRNVDKGLPCGSEAFIARLEALADRHLSFRPIGRPRTREEDKDKG